MSSAFEPTDDGGARPPGKLPYERHRRDPATIPAEPPIFEHAKWKAVRTGLTLIFWAWAAILTLGVSFLALWFGNNYLKKLDVSVMQIVGVAAVSCLLASLTVSFVGLCFCTLVPSVARARVWAIGSVVASAAAAILLGCVPVVWPPHVGPAPLEQKPAEALAPEGEAPKAPPEAPKAEAEAPKADGQPPGEAPPVNAEPLVPRLTFQRLPKLGIAVAYFLSQLFFMLFIKKVALFVHEVPLADSTGGFTTLVFFHTVLLGMLPTDALIACFFWIIMVLLEFLIVAWLLIMLGVVRRALR